MGSGVGGGGVGASETAGVGAINAALAVEAALTDAALAVEAAGAGSMASSSSAGGGGKAIIPAQPAGCEGGFILRRWGQQTLWTKYFHSSSISAASNVRLRTDCKK